MVSVWVGAPGGRDGVVGVGLVALVIVGATISGVLRLQVGVLGALVVLTVVAGVLGANSWSEAQPRHLGPYAGWATLADDPVPVGRGVRVVLNVQGERYETYVFGSQRRRLAVRQAGDQVKVEGTRVPLGDAVSRRRRERHVVGTFRVTSVGDAAPGTPLAVACNRIRAQLRRAAASAMAPDDAALFTGLVIGDDTAEPATLVQQFRAAGLSHLTAVSGQNVAFALAVLGVGLRRLPRWWRLGATLTAIWWFAALTRFEPSVLRAGMMAALAAVAFALGRDRGPGRLLCLSIIVLVLIDPMLVWSVGFWLSTGATLGVTLVAPRLEQRLRGPTWLVPTLAVTLGAQVGVLVPSWLVFHRMPVLGVPANLLAVPVAGFVMLYGIPAGMLGGAFSGPVTALVMAPATWGTRWVATVGRLAGVLQPSGAAAVVVWLVQFAIVAAMWRWKWPQRLRWVAHGGVPHLR